MNKPLKLRNTNTVPLMMMILPTILWMALFVVVPLCSVIGISFLTKDTAGGVHFQLSLVSYTQLINANYMSIMSRSFILALQTTVLCLLIGYPVAYIMAHAPKKARSFLQILVMLPFWINSVIRMYGWMTVLRTEGILNGALTGLGLIDQPLSMLYTNGAVLLGMVYELLPFAILPLYASIDKLDKSLLEAAGDLGATRSRAFLRVTFPITMPGVFASVIQTFVPSLGLFYVSDMLGGGSTMYIGNLIRDQFLSARNWPLGAALSILLIVITLILLRLYTKVGNLEDMA